MPSRGENDLFSAIEEESSLLDEELSELLKRNRATLAELHSDVKEMSKVAGGPTI